MLSEHSEFISAFQEPAKRPMSSGRFWLLLWFGFFFATEEEMNRELPVFKEIWFAGKLSAGAYLIMIFRNWSITTTQHLHLLQLNNHYLRLCILLHTSWKLKVENLFLISRRNRRYRRNFNSPIPLRSKKSLSIYINYWRWSKRWLLTVVLTTVCSMLW